MKKKLIGAAVTAAISATAPSLAVATTNISAGVWANYRYNPDSELDQDTAGDMGNESLILYGDHAQEDGPWRFSTEVRFGPGSFSDPDNNSTGSYTAIHKLWVGRNISENWDMKIGKSQVPFGWKTVNFWPGDVLLGGYGDQMDVGARFTGKVSGLDVAVAYYHQDDWGDTSTDTIDDNRHWGTSETYRKIKTGVADVSYTLSHENGSSEFGISAQAGRLEDLENNCTANSCSARDNGSHNAFAAYYEGQHGPFTAKAQAVQIERDIPNDTVDVENTRYALQGGYTVGNWFGYIDATAASADTQGSDVDTVYGVAPGVRYDYGPGWFYVEYLNQDGFIGTEGQVTEGDFEAYYVTMDYYF
jgi:hypothetical protein